MVRWRNVLLVMLIHLFTFSPFCSLTINAGNRLKKIWSKVDSVLEVRYNHTPYDTNYVVRPKGSSLTLKLRGNLSGNGLLAKGTVNELPIKSNLKTNHKATISIAAAYRGISAAFSLNPAKMKGTYEDYELNVSYYASRFCIDASYQRSSSLSGEIHYGDRVFPVESDDANMKVFNITGYYVFNHRHYSVSSAFTQSYIQQRSAGSWLAGLSYQAGSVKPGDALMERHSDALDIRIRFGHFGLGGGYGYNLVLGKNRNWLLHFSLLPTIVVYNRNKITVNDEKRDVGHMRFDMFMNGRAAVVYNFSRYFVGANALASSNLFTDKRVRVYQNKWIAHAFVGVRL